MPQDKINAYMTLHTVLVTMAKLTAPFTPFIAEEIYNNIVKNVDEAAKESVHLCDWPELWKVVLQEMLLISKTVSLCP